MICCHCLHPQTFVELKPAKHDDHDLWFHGCSRPKGKKFCGGKSFMDGVYLRCFPIPISKSPDRRGA